MALIFATAIVLRYTSIGLAIHAAGAEPRAVDKSGLSVTRVRYACVLFAGFMASLAGAFLSIGDIHTFTEGMTRGAGYLAIASVIFGKWRIGGTTLACLLFGAATALQFQLPALGIGVPNALLIISLGLARCWGPRRPPDGASDTRRTVSTLSLTITWI